MTAINKSMQVSPLMRWVMLLLVSVTMMFAYFVTDVVAPLENLVQASREANGLGWTPSEYGFFTGAYGWFNVFFLMLFIGGIILDKLGVRRTGVLSCTLMMVGAAIKFYAVSDFYPVEGMSTILGYNSQVWVAGIGFGIFGMGAEISGVTVSKAVVKWFTGKELALAMGLQVSLARLGTTAALAFSPKIAAAMGEISSPVLVGTLGLAIGLIFFITYGVLDRRGDKITGLSDSGASEEDKFKFSDVKAVFNSKGFWVIALLCLMFYSAVFPFLKYATNMMVNKYGVDPMTAGNIPALLPIGTIFLTPLFGILYDKMGKGATLMMIGSLLLTGVHILFTIPTITSSTFAVCNMILLGIAFSLVPSAMWPSVPKIIPQKQLGTAYSLIFYVQNIGLMLVPMAIGWILGNFSEDPSNLSAADYTIPVACFAACGVIATLLAFYLKVLDKKRGYNLEKPNID